MKHSKSRLYHSLISPGFALVACLLVLEFGQVGQNNQVISRTDLSLGFSYGIAHAQQKKKEERKVPLMQQATYDRLSKAQELSTAGDTEGALEILQGMLERSRRYNPNEIAQIHREIAAVYNDLDNDEKVLYHYEQMLVYRKEIREGQEHSILFILAQLYAQAERYEDSLGMIQEWLALVEDPGASPYYFVATVYYQMKNFDQAIHYMELAIQIATEAGQLPIKKGWYGMLKFLYFEKGDLNKVLEILHIMVDLYMDRTTWVEMAGVYSQLGDEKKQAYAMEAAHAAGFLDRESDYLQFGGLLMNSEAFIRAAWYLEEGFDNGLIERKKKTIEQLGQAYTAAWETELAIAVLEDGLEFAEDGRMHNRLSKLYYEQEEYGKCIDAVNEALELGDIGGDVYDTKHFRGMCEFWQGSLDLADSTFNEVRREARIAEDPAAEKGASNWLKYVDSERRRIAELRESEQM
ncbi:MAG: hypothetical protein OXC80_04340 [Gammaproteobacteria bacterium]|nr:hypothetical protein [Gammaproteobacteria bacterium]